MFAESEVAVAPDVATITQNIEKKAKLNFEQIFIVEQQRRIQFESLDTKKTPITSDVIVESNEDISSLVRWLLIELNSDERIIKQSTIIADFNGVFDLSSVILIIELNTLFKLKSVMLS